MSPNPRPPKPKAGVKLALYASPKAAKAAIPFLKSIADASLSRFPKGKKIRSSKKSKRLEISVLTPRQIQQINHRYRGKNRPTDVLAFPRLESSYAWETDLGEILICWAVAKSQAKEYGSTLRMELARLLVHGILHLFGYDHETNTTDAHKMFSLQERILKQLTPAITRGSPQWDRLAPHDAQEKSSPRKQKSRRLQK